MARSGAVGERSVLTFSNKAPKALSDDAGDNGVSGQSVRLGLGLALLVVITSISRVQSRLRPPWQALSQLGDEG